MKRLVFGDTAKEQLLEGAKLLYDAVSTTLGPKGQNAVIEAYGEPIVTHDGVTVAKAIDEVVDCSPGARVGIEMIKSSSSKTNDNVGDGTTSSTILAYHLIDKGMSLIKAGQNAMVLRRELEEAKEQALAELDKIAEPVTTEKAAIEVATISAEDPEIGRQVGKMFYSLGKDGMVAVEVGSKTETEYEIVEGYTTDRGLLDMTMITDVRTQSATVHNPYIIVTPHTVAFRDVANLLEEIYQDGGDNLVIICDGFKDDLKDQAILQKGRFDIIGIKAPGFGDQRIELINDLKKLVGYNPVEGATISLANLGSCEKIISTKEETVITGGNDVSDYIKDLEGKLKLTKGEFDKLKVEKRIAALRGRVGEIRVGGNTEMEAEERKMLIDDAVAATEAALRDGIVPGGGTTYIEIAKRLTGSTKGTDLLKEALESPFRVLMSNAGERAGVKLKELTEFGLGFDVMGDGPLVDLKEHGVIDPAMVIKQAITNAVSVAGSALTAGVIITQEKDKDVKEEE